MPSDEELERAAEPRNWTGFNVTFFVDANDSASASELAADLQRRGWQSETVELVDFESIAVRGHRLLSDDHDIGSLDAFNDEMDMLAARYGAEYDGSGVGVRQVDS